MYPLPQPPPAISTLKKKKREFLTAFRTESEMSHQQQLMGLVDVCLLCVYLTSGDHTHRSCCLSRCSQGLQVSVPGSAQSLAGEGCDNWIQPCSECELGLDESFHVL